MARPSVKWMKPSISGLSCCWSMLSWLPSRCATSLAVETTKTSSSWLLYLGAVAAAAWWWWHQQTLQLSMVLLNEPPLLFFIGIIYNPPQKHRHIACVLCPWQHQTPIVECIQCLTLMTLLLYIHNVYMHIFLCVCICKAICTCNSFIYYYTLYIRTCEHDDVDCWV